MLTYLKGQPQNPQRSNVLNLQRHLVVAKKAVLCEMGGCVDLDLLSAGSEQVMCGPS